MAIFEVPIIEHRQLTSLDLYNKFLTLSRTPLDPALVAMTTVTPQNYTNDYWVEGLLLKWEGTPLDIGPEALVTGEILHIYYSTENSLNTFSTAPLRNNIPVTSTINMEALLAIIGGDTYYDIPGKIDRVDVTYIHEDLRESKTIVHAGDSLTGPVFWSTYSRSGVWHKMRLRVRDKDGAVTWIYRDQIGVHQDLILS